MNSVRNTERKHIAFVGRRNVGKSSLINSFLGRDLSVVSNVPSTTTSPIRKTTEFLPYGPVMLIDTAGIDDIGEFGKKRISKTLSIISSADFIIVVLDATRGLGSEEEELIKYLKKISTPFLAAINKIELGVNPILLEELKVLGVVHFEISCAENVGIDILKARITRSLPEDKNHSIVGDLVKRGDVIVLVVPIDLSTPKGRLILPQVQAIREALDEDTIVIVIKDKELRSVLNKLKEPPSLVVVDSQSIIQVAAEVPDDIKLTTFSILMARYKGDLFSFVKGLKKVDELQDGDKVLIAEACSHHSQEDDIGTVKIPRWLKLHTKKNITIEIAHGHDYPENLSDFKLIIHCGGCMITRNLMLARIKHAKFFDIPIVNYGMIISYMHGAIPRVLVPFGDKIY